jgi:hypothetical protein
MSSGGAVGKSNNLNVLPAVKYLNLVVCGNVKIVPEEYVVFQFGIITIVPLMGSPVIIGLYFDTL